MMESPKLDTRMACEDLLLGFRQFPLAYRMARQDLKLRYARSIFGPLWITATMGLYTLAISFVFGGLFGSSVRDLIPWITLGLIAWNFISAVLMESGVILHMNRGIILQSRMSVSTFIILVILKNLMIGMHHLLIFPIMMLLLGIPLSWSILWVFFGIPVILLFAFGMGLFAAIAGSRFRDLPPFFGSLTTIGLLFIPVMWRPGDLQRYQAIADYNPLTYILSLFRDPLLGVAPSSLAIIVSLGACAVMLAAGLALLAATRRRVMFWI